VAKALSRRSHLAAQRSRQITLPLRPDQSLRSLCNDLPPVVYFIRTRDGLIKIGHTINFYDRKTAFDKGWLHILAIIPGSRQAEADMHKRFAEHLAQGREYFHPAPELIDHINEIRASLGVGPVEAWAA
jgi:hypothetical protein